MDATKNTSITLIVDFYREMSPAILGGILNMCWCTHLRRRDSHLLVPIDLNIRLWDGQFLFGENKTWGGLIGMIAWTGASAYVLRPLWMANSSGESRTEEIRPTLTLKEGAHLGLAYAIGELPNSFLKRRLAVVPGRTASGAWMPITVIYDQIDSILTCIYMLHRRNPMDAGRTVQYLFLGGLTHVGLSYALYLLGLRRNPL